MKKTSIASALAVVAATLCAALPVGATYDSGLMMWLLCAAAAGGALTTAYLRARRSSGVALLGSLVVMLAGVVVLGLRLPRPQGWWLTATAEALVNSGARILTSVVPVTPTVETVALPFCATWLATSAAMVLLASRRPAAAGLPPVVLFLASLVFIGPTSTPSYGYAAVLVGAVALLLGLVTRPGIGGTVAGASRGRLPTFAAGGLALLLGVGTAGLGPALLAGSDPPPDLRTHVVPPYENPEQINPLSMLSGWAAQPDHPLFEVTTDRPTPLRWVTLPEFTGINWLPAAAYRAAGAMLPPMAADGPTQVHQDVSITGLTGGWLPVPNGVREVHGVRLAVDVESDTLAAPDGLANGVRYTVTAVPPRWQADDLSTARLPTGEAYDPYRSLPAGGPARLYEVARKAAGTGSPYQQAKGLEEFLRHDYGFDPQSLGGGGYPSIDRFLFQPPELGGGRGTSEQFATAFAVLARSLGIPARVAVGFGPGTSIGVNRYRVTGADAIAWPEIYLDGQGWVPFEPTPTESSLDAAGLSPIAPATAPTPKPQPPKPEPTDPIAGDQVSAPVNASPPIQSGSLVTGLVTAGISVLSAFLLLFGLRSLRGAARLRRGDPADRVLGAWVELRNGLRLAGRPPAAALSVDEVATLASADLDLDARRRAIALADRVNATGFGYAILATADADRAAQDVRALRRALWRRSKLGRRLVWPVDPRPLWWR